MAKIQSRDVRDAFLSHGPEIITRLINYASGFDVKEDGTRGDYNGELDVEILMQLTNKLVPMMSLDDDQQEMKNNKLAKAKTIQELMELKNEGLISQKQLNQYTEILKTNYEITELNQLIEKLEEIEGTTL